MRRRSPANSEGMRLPSFSDRCEHSFAVCQHRLRVRDSPLGLGISITGSLKQPVVLGHSRGHVALEPGMGSSDGINPALGWFASHHVCGRHNDANALLTPPSKVVASLPHWAECYRVHCTGDLQPQLALSARPCPWPPVSTTLNTPSVWPSGQSTAERESS